MPRLKELRIAQNITLRAMAEILGMGQRNYQKYETVKLILPCLRLSSSPTSSTYPLTISWAARMILHAYKILISQR